MPVIGTRSFKGEIPRTEPHLLPDENAQQAIDCHFANGSLKSMYGNPYPISTNPTLANPAKGIYTNDGIWFYSWPTEAQTYRSPVIDDTYRRVYYLQPSVGEFRVATEDALGSQRTPSGVKAGVPRVVAAPVLSVVDRTIIPGYESKTVNVTMEAWWEDTSGKEYARASVTPAVSAAYKRYTFTPPAAPDPGTTGATYKLCAKISFKEATSNTDVLSGTVRGSVTSKSSALPGGVEFSIEQSASSSTMVLTWGVVETRAYVYTGTNTWDEEGAPSPASTISVTYMQDVKIGVTPVDFTGYRTNKLMKLYRTFGSTAVYIESDYEWTESYGNFVYDRYWKPKAGGKMLESNDWTPPPTGLKGSALMSNGWFAAFKENTLYMSEPYRPHAWPYSMTFPKSIRGIKAAQQSLVVTTSDGVYVVAGSHPKAAQSIKLSTPQAGIAQRCMANIDGAVAYLSNDGFILVEGTSATPDVSQKLFDRRTWRERYSSQLTYGDIMLEYYDGALIGIPMSSASEPKGFMIRMDDGGGSFTQLSLTADALYQLPVNDALYYSRNGQLYQFGTGVEIPFDWWSKDHIYQNNVTFGAGYARYTGSLTFMLYADGDLVYTKTLSGPGAFRLTDKLPKSLRWSYRLVGTGVVKEFLLARSMVELQTV